MTGRTLNLWRLVHKWSSLLCTVFLLILGATGLPLIFADEIRDMLAQEVEAPKLEPEIADLPLDDLVAEIRRRHPDEYVQFVFWPPHPHVVGVGMGPAQNVGLDRVRRRQFDARTGDMLADRPPAQGPMETILGLHRELLLGTKGTLFLGVMGLSFVLALLSGIVIYGPYMQKLPFGAIRNARVARVRWLDMHNLLGIVTVTWALVVGVTGSINTLERFLFSKWSSETMPALLAPYRGKPVPDVLSSAAAAVDTARAALPGNKPTSIGFPYSRFGSPRHYLIWMKGETPVTAHLFTPVLVDAETGELSASRSLPWYLKVLELSRPLHFGDYGGLPMQVLWAVLDIVTMVVLGSGMYLWLGKRE